MEEVDCPASNFRLRNGDVIGIQESQVNANLAPEPLVVQEVEKSSDLNSNAFNVGLVNHSRRFPASLKNPHDFQDHGGTN